MKYFSPKEFTCDSVNCFDKMSPKLLEMLEKARKIAGTPFNITSSWRSEEKNQEVGGKSNSAHLRGLAVDVACPSSFQRLIMLEALIGAGFTRIGVAKTFIHVDCDNELPQEVMWIY